jgi:nickel/cobalt transporter (NicO) family protein
VSLVRTAPPALGPLGDQLLGAVDAPAFVPVALAVALGAGALHALLPGHGKSLAAAYLVAAHGRHRDALALGGAVALMHTVSVLVVALVWTGLSTSGALDLGPASRVLQTAAAGLVVVAGILLVRRLSSRQSGSPDHPPHDHSGQARPALVLLGASGGLLPSPSALLVLLTGLFSGRTALGLVLVTAFGLGMAVVLAAIGLATVAGRDLLMRAVPAGTFLRHASRIGPRLGAWGILATGCLLTAAALSGSPVI